MVGQIVSKRIADAAAKGILSLAKGAANPKHPFFKELSTIWNKPAVQKDYFNEVIYSPSLNKTGTRNELIESVSTADKVGKSKSLFDLAHLQQKQFRREGYSTEEDYKFIQNLNNEVNSYVKEGTGRTLNTLSSQKQDNKIFLHPDFKTPDKLVSKMDFTIHGNKVKLLGEDTPFTTQSEGFITNQIRNRSYHKHYENRLARWLTEKKLIEKAFQDNKITKGRMLTDMEAANSHITNIERDMRKLGLTSAIWDNAKNTFKYYGKPYDKQVESLLEDMQKTYILRNPPDRLQEGFNNRLIEYFMKRIGHKEGGIVDYGEMKPVVPPLDPGERQHLNPGGTAAQAGSKIATQYIKKQILPKVIGHTTKIMEKLAAPKDAPEIKPFAVVDREGLPIKDFKTQKEAEKWLYDKKETVPENEYYESTIDYSVKPISEIKTQTAVEDTPAMMWKTPSVIADAPMNVAQGKQWLGILKKAGVSPKELEDTSMGPFLNNLEPNSKFTKQELLNEFDELVPKISVIATGKRDQGKYVKNITDKFNAIRDRINTFDGKDQQVLNTFAGILQKAVGSKTDKQLNVLANQVNKTLGQAYGMKNALMSESILQNNQIPAPIRSIFGDMQELFKTRGAVHKFSKGPSHTGDQVLPGGVNYREYLFKYNPNYLREMEPKYSPGHSFGFTDDMAQNTFVHARISDRTDNFGRKLMFIEEIQSDMHQRPQKALRRGEEGVYATRGDKVESVKPLIALLQKTQNKIDKILASDPNNPTLPKLYKERAALSENINDIRGKTSAKSRSSTPEGPFQRSEDYGAFVTKYLLRLAKEGGYDGIAVSTGNIKTKRGYDSEEQKKGHFGFYDKIMNKVLKKIAKNSDVEYITTVINDGNLNWGNVPVLLVKAADKIMKGLPSYKDGGLHRENFVDVVPLL
tara:strand:+ start:117 stop:2864 length:2748 start_codon:yes stop_codon:yes gene_type:complete